MNRSCSHEHRTDGRSRAMTAGERQHAKECSDCRDTIHVRAALSELAGIVIAEAPLPDPRLVWMRADLIPRALLEPAPRSLSVVSMLSYFLVALGWSAVLVWKWPLIQSWLGSGEPAKILAESALTGGTFSFSFFAIVGILTAATGMLGLQAVFAEE